MLSVQKMAEVDETVLGSASDVQIQCSEGADSLNESCDSSRVVDGFSEPHMTSTSTGTQEMEQFSREENLQSDASDVPGIKGLCTGNSNQNNNEVRCEDLDSASLEEKVSGQSDETGEGEIDEGLKCAQNNLSEDHTLDANQKVVNSDVDSDVTATSVQAKESSEEVNNTDSVPTDNQYSENIAGSVDDRTCPDNNLGFEPQKNGPGDIDSTPEVFSERISSDGGSVEIAEEADEEETDSSINAISSNQLAKTDPLDRHLDATDAENKPQQHSKENITITPAAVPALDASRHEPPSPAESPLTDEAVHICTEKPVVERDSNNVHEAPDPDQTLPSTPAEDLHDSRTAAKPADSPEDDLLSALEAELEEESDTRPPDLEELDMAQSEDSGGGDRSKLLKLVEEWKQKYCHAQAELQSLQVTAQARSHQHADQDERRDRLEAEAKKRAEAVQRVQLHRITELEKELEQKQKEIATAKERQIAHDTAAKKAISKLQTEMVQRIDQVKHLYEEAVKEKENMVIRYAKSEKENLDLKKAREELDRRRKDAGQGLEVITAHNKQLKADRAKLMNDLDAKDVEITTLKREMEQMTDDVSSVGIKVKWAQNKLKTELESHKETKAKLAKTEQRLVEAKEETEQIRKNCQEMIRTYQESEEIRSNSLDIQLKEKEQELKMQFQEKEDQMEVHNSRLKELEALKKTHHDTIAELDSLKVKSQCLEDERLHTEGLLTQFKGLLNSQKEENRKLAKQMDEVKALKRQLEESKESIQLLEQSAASRQEDEKELEAELGRSREKEAELLQFTEKMTGKNATLHSENLTLGATVDSLTEECRVLKADLEEARAEITRLTSELGQERQYREREASLLSARLGEKSKTLDQLRVQLDDARDETKTLRRKHTANLKDLTRQLQHAKKKIESLEAEGSNSGNGKDAFSSESRTSSTGSLDTLGNSALNGGGPNSASSGSGGSVGRQEDSPQAGQDHTVAIAGGNDFPGIDKAMLVDRIVRLQKQLQKRAEKSEFLQEHVNQLVEALQKKSKIIQQYIMREEAGALSPAVSDANKAQMSKQSGIMASVYRSHAVDPNMTLDLSLEINRKLQAVLEDTLLKNITLKENIDTLGQEIARLSEEAQMSSSRRSQGLRRK